MADIVKNTLTLDKLNETCTDISDKTEEYVEKADSLIIDRVVRVMNHAPVLVTLMALADKTGMSISPDGFSAAPEAFEGLTGDLEIPGWCYNVWAIAAFLQLGSVARSVLADSDELSQNDITAAAVTNYAVARMIGSTNALLDTIIVALLAGHAMRSGSAGDVTIHNASVQLVSAFTTTVAVLGVVAAIASRIPILKDIDATGPLTAVIAMHAITNRSGNGQVKEVVNGAILGGMALSAIRGGISLDLDVDNILSLVTTAGLLYVAYSAVDNARTALMN
jgi:hypothetical protein